MAFNGVQDKITHHLDVLGFYCPVPLHETKKALQELSVGDVIGVRTDDPETLHDIPMFSIEPNMYCMMSFRSEENFALSLR